MNALANWYRRTTEGIEAKRAEIEHKAREDYDRGTRALARTTDRVGGAFDDGVNQLKAAADQQIAALRPRPVAAATPAPVANRASLPRDRMPGRTMTRRPRPSETVFSALFEDHLPTEPPPPQRPVDKRVVNRRMDELSAIIGVDPTIGFPETSATGWPAAALIWLDNVWPHHAWDDKNLIDPQTGKRDGGLELQGNFSYGATAQALGLPEDFALRGAGAAQRLSNGFGALWRGARSTPSLGGPFDVEGVSAYGDDPRDQAQIREGYQYARGRR